MPLSLNQEKQMAKSQEYFQGAATAVAGVTIGKRGKRRDDLIDRAHHRIKNQGIKREAFGQLVDKAERVSSRARR